MSAMDITRVLSFNAKDKTGRSIEADFAFLWKERWAQRKAKEGAIFGECKSFGEFKKEDYAKMEILANAFPGAMLAFCTLRKELKPSEVKAIRRIAKNGRKKIVNMQPVNPVAIVTGNELFTYMFDVPQSWSDSGINEKPMTLRNLHQLADISNQVYLGLEPWRDEWERRTQRK